MTQSNSYQEKLEFYEKLVSSLSSVQRKGKTMLYTSPNGHMFSFLSKEGTVGIRLSPEDREDFTKAFNVKLAIQYGAVMKEYVEIPGDSLGNIPTLSEYTQKSYDYVSSLKPKPTKK